MIGIVIWVIGLILTIKAAMEIMSLNGNFAKKLLAVVALLLTSWIGLIVYYFFAKDKMAEWMK